jgi:hypothetical protein
VTLYLCGGLLTVCHQEYNREMKLLRILALVSLFVSAAWAQSMPKAESKGTLSGTVVDASGAVILGAKVTLKGATPEQSTVTDNEGVFSFAYLSKGSYSMSVEKAVFKTAEIKGVEVESGKSSTILVTMVAVSSYGRIEINDPALTIDTTSSSPHNCITDHDMQSLPLDGSIASAISKAGRCP